MTDWNICDKQFATCKNLYAAYKCHCKTGYEDFVGNGAQCLGKWEFFLSQELYNSMGFINFCEGYVWNNSLLIVYSPVYTLVLFRKQSGAKIPWTDFCFYRKYPSKKKG